MYDFLLGPLDLGTFLSNPLIILVCLSFVAKEGAKTASSVGVIAFGLGVTGIILYTVFNELFSGSGPTKLFQKASDQCVRDPRVQDMLGEPIKAFGEETRRGRRKHVRYCINR